MAEKRTVNIHGKEYELVASRVERFREDHPDYAIITDIVERDESVVVMKALIYKDKETLIATGFSEEFRTESGINSTSALEVAETSAIGRALANLGYIGAEYASADEVANAISNQGQTKVPSKATDKQVAYIVSLFKQGGSDDPEYMKNFVEEVLGKAKSANELTAYEAKKVIDALKETVDEINLDRGAENGPAQ